VIHVIKRKALVPYTPEQMYTLVNKVEDYPQFVPWCVASKVLSKTETEVLAALDLSAKGIHKSFTTRNTLSKNKCIKLTLVDGPFKHLEGVWHFEALPDGAGCQIRLDLEFELSKEWFSHLFGALFTQVANKLVNTFCERADEVYKK